jgi:hypothetical protein
MLEKQIDQAERRAVLRNDLRVRQQQEQASTYMAQTHSEMGGRYSGVGAQTIVGAEPHTNYPAASPALQTELPPEPPLGYEINRMPELEPTSHVEAQDPESVASPSFLKRRKL